MKLRVLLVIGLAALLAACGGTTSDDNGADPYADLDVDPPAVIEDPTVQPSFSPSAPDAGGLIELNVSGLALGSTEGLSGLQVAELTAADFTVVEDDTVKGITVERIRGGAAAGADIVFALDTTASMGTGLNSVREGISDFVGFLEESGLDVRVGALAFGDAYDTLAEPTSSTGESYMEESPPSFDRRERPSFALTDDYDAFMAFVEYEARDGGRSGGDAPENSLGAIEYAYDTAAYGWRPGAQRIIVVMTDQCSHNATASTSITEPWLPSSAEDVNTKLRGSATVHVVSLDASHNCGNYTNLAELTGVSGTGGVLVPWDGRSDFDLRDLPITDVVAGGYIVTFRGTIDGSEHAVRLVIDDGDGVRGESTIRATY